ncbi:MAG: hypothetical protein RIS76_1989, partial [Verrucomicrobiota bacterium]
MKRAALSRNSRRVGLKIEHAIAALVIVLLRGPFIAVSAPPDWAAHAVWYQIFPERYRNGDPANDPTPASLAGTWPYFVPT